MILYSILNDAVAVFGLEVAVLLMVTALLTGLLAISRKWQRPLPRIVELSVWLPCLLATLLVAWGIAEYWRMISLLGQQAAISQAQRQLMVHSAIWGAARRLAIGAAGTLWLRRLRRYTDHNDRNTFPPIAPPLNHD